MRQHYDIAVIGAGPVGSVSAIVHAQKGARVALLEANPKAASRLAGEWLHPPALEILRKLGVDFDTRSNNYEGKGFVVFPEDGIDPIPLPYAEGVEGICCEHSELVSSLHRIVKDEPNIDFLVPARVRSVEQGMLTYACERETTTLSADRIIGADGRQSVVRKSLGLATKPIACSRMVGTVVEDVDLPMKGYGHVILGGPGPMLLYHLRDNRVRIIFDVPLELWIPRDRVGMLVESYSRLLPEAIRPKFEEAILKNKFHYAQNATRQRTSYGTADRVLVGDAAGHYHPMTAVGMTLGFFDALALAEGMDFEKFKSHRIQATRAPEFLAIGLYEVFADHRAESFALRKSIYRTWQSNTTARDRTIELLACRDTSTVNLAATFTYTVLHAIRIQIPRSFDRFAWRKLWDTQAALAKRLWYLTWGITLQRTAKVTDEKKQQKALSLLARAFLISIPSQDGELVHISPKEVNPVDIGPALNKATKRLLEQQNADGSWEGEMVWCPMLTAQYVLTHYIIGQPLSESRKAQVLKYFEHSQYQDGTWGMHDHSPPSLFVTTLVYVAARLMGVERADPLLEPALRFIRNEEVLSIPSWGKFWLALLNLYDWNGVNAIIPELWRIPSKIALHPSNWYCHTRLIYMAMSAIFASRHQVGITVKIEQLRKELYPQGYATENFQDSRNRLRKDDLFKRPGVILRIGFRCARLFDLRHNKQTRERCVNDMLQRIKWELNSSDHTSISPVSGLLNIIALWLHDADDPDMHQALSQLNGWIWEDDDMGARVTGARSGSWDTGFALQALSEVPTVNGLAQCLSKGTEFLQDNQIKESFTGFKEAYRADPKGGWCFAGGWHGWPVSDCTAEATLGLIATEGKNADPLVIADSIEFMLRSQNRDGGFGSYEARRSRLGLEWLNPAEMFGESMTEHSFVECTASCLAALAACRKHFPLIGANNNLTEAMHRGQTWLRKIQTKDGSWRGVWGVQYIYGTMFGIRGLLAAGASQHDPAVRLACQWLLSHQREDGGWGEHHSGCMTGRYVEHDHSQVVQTAWALLGLLEAGDSNWNAITRGVKFLVDSQKEDGSWPKQDMAGVFFRTALLDYVLYRQYFPLHALGLYEQRWQFRERIKRGTEDSISQIA